MLRVFLLLVGGRIKFFLSDFLTPLFSGRVTDEFGVLISLLLEALLGFNLL